MAPDTSLDHLIEKTKSSSYADLLPDELAYLVTAFLPTEDLNARSKAYLILSSFCQGVRASAFEKAKAHDAGKETLIKVFGPPVVSNLGDPGDRAFLTGICFLTALFQVDWEAATAIFTQDDLVESILDQTDVSPPSSLPHIARLFGQAAGHKPCRAVFTSHTIEWLQKSSRQTTDVALRAAAGVALIKLSRNKGSGSITLEDPSLVQKLEKDIDYCRSMKEILISSHDGASVADAVEGLAYLSTNPDVKEEIAADSRLLSSLFTFIPRKKQLSNEPSPDQSTIIYGILVIIAQLCAYRPQMTEEQVQIERLKQMAQAGKKGEASEPSPLDGKDYVTKRIGRLLVAGVLEALVAASAARLDSMGVRVMIGKAMLNIVEVQAHRGEVLQSGGAKALLQVIKRGLTDKPSDSTPLGAGYLDAIQALAKLAITSSPVQVFGPSEASMYDVVRPFSILLQHASSTLLQRFEALMALTNLASQSSELSKRIARAEGLVNKVELLMLEDHDLVRRAAVELLCNLVVGADEVFDRYGGSSASANSRSKLEILLALSDVEDVPTKLAASGALATLSLSEHACAMLLDLQLEKHRAFQIFADLISPNMADTDSSHDNPGLVHRGIVCVRNIVMSVKDSARRRDVVTEAGISGLTQSLEKALTKGPRDALKPLVESLNVLRSQ